MKKKLLIPMLAFTQLVSSVGFAQSADLPEVAQEEEKKSSTSFINLLENALAAKKLKASLKVFDEDFGHGIYIDGKAKFESAPSVGGLYSRVDAFSVGGRVLVNELLNKDGETNSSAVQLGVGVSRELIFVRQFVAQNKSVFTLPMALTRLPKNSQKALALNEGTFVSFRAPMSVQLSRGASAEVLKILKGTVDLGASAYLMALGEFDIHVFRMNKNMVRVKLFALNQHGGGVDMKLSVLGLFPGAGRLAKFLNLDIITAGWNHMESKLFLADYIFNLNTDDGRQAYDGLMGQKYKMTDFPLLSVVPQLSSKDLKGLLFSSLEEVDKVVGADANLPLDQRRVMQVIKGENKTSSNGTRFKFDLKFLKVVNTTSWSDGTLNLYNERNEITDRYRIKGKSNHETKKYSLFWLKGGEEKHDFAGSLISKMDREANSTEFTGFSWTHRYEDSKFKKLEYDRAIDQMKSILPEKFKSGIRLPKWTHATVVNAYIEREIFIGKEGLQALQYVSKNQIMDQLKEILRTSFRIKSLPYGITNLELNEATPHDQRHRIEAYLKGDYVAAYDWDINYMASFITKWADPALSMKDRELEYDKLSHYTPVFFEVGPLFFLKAIPEDVLAKSLIMRLRMSAKDQPGYDECFPTKSACHGTNIFREVSSQNNMITEKSFNLRHFMNEKAEIYTPAEIMLKK